MKQDYYIIPEGIIVRNASTDRCDVIGRPCACGSVHDFDYLVTKMLEGIDNARLQMLEDCCKVVCKGEYSCNENWPADRKVAKAGETAEEAIWRYYHVYVGGDGMSYKQLCQASLLREMGEKK